MKFAAVILLAGAALAAQCEVREGIVGQGALTKVNATSADECCDLCFAFDGCVLTGVTV